MIDREKAARVPDPAETESKEDLAAQPADQGERQDDHTPRDHHTAKEATEAALSTARTASAPSAAATATDHLRDRPTEAIPTARALAADSEADHHLARAKVEGAISPPTDVALHPTRHVPRAHHTNRDGREASNETVAHHSVAMTVRRSGAMPQETLSRTAPATEMIGRKATSTAPPRRVLSTERIVDLLALARRADGRLSIASLIAASSAAQSTDHPIGSLAQSTRAAAARALLARADAQPAHRDQASADHPAAPNTANVRASTDPADRAKATSRATATPVPTDRRDHRSAPPPVHETAKVTPVVHLPSTAIVRGSRDVVKLLTDRARHSEDQSPKIPTRAFDRVYPPKSRKTPPFRTSEPRPSRSRALSPS